MLHIHINSADGSHAALLHCSQIKMLADNPDNWALLLGAAFPNSSNFFLVRETVRSGVCPSPSLGVLIFVSCCIWRTLWWNSDGVR